MPAEYQIAPVVLDGPINRLVFKAHVGVLVPRAEPGAIVIMGNLSSHKEPGARETIQAAGGELLFLPVCSSDLNPIEIAFSKLGHICVKLPNAP